MVAFYQFSRQKEQFKIVKVLSYKSSSRKLLSKFPKKVRTNNISDILALLVVNRIIDLYKQTFHGYRRAQHTRSCNMKRKK